MTKPDDLLAAIIEDPANDDLRLVFADLLDDRGEGDRAEFIRVQCEIARLQAEEVARFNEETDWSQCTGIAASWCPNCGGCVCPFPEDERCSPNCPLHNRHSSHCCLEDIADKRERLREREVELFSPDWLPDFDGQLREWYFECFPADYQPERPFGYCVSRGFVSEVQCTYSDWARHADAITSRCPIERVALTTMPTWFKSYPVNDICLIENEPHWFTQKEINAADRSNLADALLCLRWPRITFALPSEVAV